MANELLRARHELAGRGGSQARTGSYVQHQFALMRARITARYKLVTVPGRPEELAEPGVAWKTQDRLGVSMGYGCKTIRVRTMVGRRWVDHVDFQIGEGWGGELYAFLDRHFSRAGSKPILSRVQD